MNTKEIIQEIKNLFKANKQEEPLTEDASLQSEIVVEPINEEIKLEETIQEEIQPVEEIVDEKAIDLETENEIKKIMDEIQNLKSRLEEITNINVDLEKENLELKSKVEELSKMDATAPVKEMVSNTKEKSNFSNKVINRIEKLRIEKGLGNY